MKRRVVLLTGLMLAASTAAAVVTETYTDRAAFEARLAGAVVTLGFDDVDTAAEDPAAFAADRYAASHGVIVTGEAGQYASRAFGFPDDYPISSPPNHYAPGGIEPILGGGNQTDVTFVAGEQPASVAGFGAVFVDPDLDGLSRIVAFDADGALLETASLPEANEALVFAGVVTVDETTGLPTPAIAHVLVVNGTGWPAAALNDGVPLDDFVFAEPAALPPTTTTTTTTVVPSTTTSTTLCPVAPVAGCRKPTAPGASLLVLRRKARPAGNRLVWRWGSGAATATTDFGDPAAATPFAVCTYGPAGRLLEATVSPAGTCGRRACWKTTRNGFVYRDSDAAFGGIRLLRLKAGADGRAHIVLVARGARLPLPELPLATPVTAQLVRGDGGGCWDATFGSVRKNMESRFKARSE